MCEIGDWVSIIRGPQAFRFCRKNLKHRYFISPRSWHYFNPSTEKQSFIPSQSFIDGFRRSKLFILRSQDTHLCESFFIAALVFPNGWRARSNKEKNQLLLPVCEKNFNRTIWYKIPECSKYGWSGFLLVIWQCILIFF